MGMNFIYAPTNESFEDIFANIVMAGFEASKPVSDPMDPYSDPWLMINLN